MRIGIVRASFGYEGGFELNLRRLRRELTVRGHEVVERVVEADPTARRPFGVRVPGPLFRRSPDFFLYSALVDAVRSLTPPPCDVVLTTNPATIAVSHPRKAALFYHHVRVFYDLSTVFVTAGFADPAFHAAAQRAVRAMDDAAFATVRCWVAGSETIERRLGLYHRDLAPIVGFRLPLVHDDPQRTSSTPGHSVLCVSRHEFPKRTELFVHAMKYLPDLEGVSVGAGGRVGWVRTLDRRLTRSDVDLDALTSRDVWLRPHHGVPDVKAERYPGSNVRFLSNLSTAALHDRYADALCVVAPAYDEDYGHTGVEALVHGRPLVVCEDGGGLTEFVTDGENGFIVEPTGRAIAAAVRRLHEDRDLALHMGQRARERAREYTWERATAQLLTGLELAAA